HPAIKMERIQPFIDIVRVLIPAQENPYPAGGPCPTAGGEGFDQAAEVALPALVEIGIGGIDIIGRDEFESRVTKAQARIPRCERRFEFDKPRVDQRLIEEALAECEWMRVRKSPVTVLRVRKIFFVADEEI